MNYTKLYNDLKKHEGFKTHLYDDLSPNKIVNAPKGKYTIGIGHNIESNGLSNDVINLIFEEDVKIAIASCEHIFSNWKEIDHDRQAIFANMAFNMGIRRLSGFKRMIKAAHKYDWQAVSAEMLDSKWTRELDRLGNKRARELAHDMGKGAEV